MVLHGDDGVGEAGDVAVDVDHGVGGTDGQVPPVSDGRTVVRFNGGMVRYLKTDKHHFRDMIENYKVL